jgi:hypothetical protein
MCLCRPFSNQFQLSLEGGSGCQNGFHVICPYNICPDTFAHTTFAQKDICPDTICPERHLPRNTFFFLEAFCDISHRLGGITPYGVFFSDAFLGLKMWITFACATANFLTHFIISIAVLENVPPDAGLHKRATFPH